MKPTAYKLPKPKLKEGVIYSGDNGRLFCRSCAGQTALYTGRDLSGQKVEAVHVDENVLWRKEFGKDMACERGCTKYSTPLPLPPPVLEMVSAPVKGAPAGQWWPNLFLRKGRTLYPIKPEQFGEVRERYNAGRGASEISQDLGLHNEYGEHIGYISYNGRGWLNDIEGKVEIPAPGIKTVKERDAEGWK
jgi:hypothetical protein